MIVQHAESQYEVLHCTVRVKTFIIANASYVLAILCAWLSQKEKISDRVLYSTSRRLYRVHNILVNKTLDSGKFT